MLQARQLEVSNFRGIASLNWSPKQAFCCQATARARISRSTCTIASTFAAGNTASGPR